MNPARGEALYRLLTTAELLRQFEFAVGPAVVNREVGQRTGVAWCLRTTRRDLVLLERCGLARRERGRFRWIGQRSLIETKPEAVKAAAG